MKRIMNLKHWIPVELDEWYETSTHMVKAKKFLINTTEKVEIWALVQDGPKDEPREVLIGTADGLEEFEVSTAQFVYTVRSAYDAQVFIQINAKPQIVKGYAGESHTDIHPRKRRNSDLERMMHFMRVTNEQRERQYAENEKRQQARYSKLEAEIKKGKANEHVIESEKPKAEPKPQEPNAGDAEVDKKDDKSGKGKQPPKTDE